jgi:hypothetical protein
MASSVAGHSCLVANYGGAVQGIELRERACTLPALGEYYFLVCIPPACAHLPEFGVASI